MPVLSPSTDRFGAWGAGPLTGTVTKPPPSATAGTGYIPHAPMGVPAESDAGDGGGFAGGTIGGDFHDMGPNPEWGGPDMGGKYGAGKDSTRGGWGGGPGTGGNGSESGMGGAGLDGGGGAGPLHGGVMAMDDGGEVDDGDGDDDGQQAQAAPTGDVNSAMGEPGGQQSPALDPMSIIKNAMSFGRQQMGLPPSFSDHFPMSQNVEDRRGNMDFDDANGHPFPGGAEPTLKAPSAFDASMRKNRGFADGGEVPMPGDDQQQQQPQQGGGMPDPRKTMAYLSGAGGVQPEIAEALERHIDPQGAMDPAERALKAISMAPTPESQFGLMQHYRTRANAYSGAARAALDQGNLAQAAQHATSMFNNTPTGYKVQFAPAQGGLAMIAKKIGQQTGQPQQGLSDGGAVDADNPAVMMKGYDDGGEVTDDDDDDQGVLPTGDEGGAAGGGAGGEGDGDQTGSIQQQAPQPQQSPDMQQPVVLPPDQVKKLVEPGAVDAANDHPKGFMGWLTDLLSKATSRGAPAAPGAPATQGGQALQASGGVGGLLRQGVKSVMSSMSSGTQDDVQSALDADKQQQGPQPQQGGAPKPQNAPTPGTPAPTPGAGAGQLTPRSTPGFSGVDKSVQAPQPAQDPMDQQLARLRKQADAIYGPVMSAEVNAQKQAYITKGMEAAQGNAAKLEQTNAAWGGRSSIASDRNTAAGTRQQASEDGKNNRQAASLSEKLQQTQLTVNGRAANAAQTNLVRLIGQQIGANPTGAANPDAILKAIQPYQAQMKQLGVTPRDVMQNIQQAQQGGQQGQTGQQPQVGERKQFKQGWGVWDGTAWKPE